MTLITKSIKYLFLFFVLLIIILIALLFVIKEYNHGAIYNKFFEKNAPNITILNDFIGIGSNPKTLSIELEDMEAGLDAVTVKLHQKNRYVTLKTEDLKGIKKTQLNIVLDFKELKLTEGVATLEIKAFDKSFWSNTSEKEVILNIDLRMPSLKIITSQHNLLLNGVQLVVYQAMDDNLSKHGVEVAGRFFQGFPAFLLDKKIKDNSIYATFYSIYSDDDKDLKPVVIAQDGVGNKVEKTFYNKKIKRNVNDYSSTISQYFINTLEKRLSKSSNISTNVFLKNILEVDFKNESEQIFIALHDTIFKLPLNVPFVMQKGTVLKNFGSSITYTYKENTIATKRETGMTLALTGDDDTVNAISDGVVVFVKKMKSYGNVVAISHGGSIVAIYAMAGEPLVKSGDTVEVSQPLLKRGNSGISVLDSEYLLEIRVDGYPVNPQEFFDNFWCQEHITDKVHVVKEDLGIVIPEFDF